MPAEVDYRLLRDFDPLGPIAPGDPDALVGIRGLTVGRVRAAAGGHTSLVLRRGREVLDGIAFGRDDLAVEPGARATSSTSPRAWTAGSSAASRRSSWRSATWRPPGISLASPPRPPRPSPSWPEPAGPSARMSLPASRPPSRGYGRPPFPFGPVVASAGLVLAFGLSLVLVLGRLDLVTTVGPGHPTPPPDGQPVGRLHAAAVGRPGLPDEGHHPVRQERRHLVAHEPERPAPDVRGDRIAADLGTRGVDHLLHRDPRARIR